MEVNVVGSEYRVDVLLQLQAGIQIALEVVDTHDISGLKLMSLLQEGFLVLRIDAKAVRHSMRNCRSTLSNLAHLLEGFGCWQTWPALIEPPQQLPLTLSPRLPTSLLTWVGAAVRALLGADSGRSSATFLDLWRWQR
jgi:hypothetical protein